MVSVYLQCIFGRSFSNNFSGVFPPWNFQFLKTASLRIFTTQQTRTDWDQNYVKCWLPLSWAFPRLSGEQRETIRESWRQARSARGGWRNERRAQAVSHPRFQLIINSNIPQKLIAEAGDEEEILVTTGAHNSLKVNYITYEDLFILVKNKLKYSE